MGYSPHKKAKFRHTIGVVVFNNSGKILLHLRDNKKGIDMPGIWALFGGEIKSGESGEEAAYREVEEETGMKLTNLTYLKKVIFEDRDSLIYYSKMDMEDNAKIRVNEGMAAKFFSMEEVHQLFKDGQTHQTIIDILTDFFHTYKSPNH